VSVEVVYLVSLETRFCSYSHHGIDTEFMGNVIVCGLERRCLNIVTENNHNMRAHNLPADPYRCLLGNSLLD